MAIYAYKCEAHDLFDQEFAIGTAPNQVTCPICGAWSNKTITAIPAILKGQGWASKS